MSLPAFSTQAELFSTAGLSGTLFAATDRYRLFAQLIYPQLAAARPILERCYCLDNGRAALEPVLLLGVSLLQEIDAVPDRQALELLRYHAGWNFALNRQLGDAVFHPTSLVHFRSRLHQHDQSAIAFKAVLDALQEAGLVSRQSRQRLDSTQMFARVAKMGRLECVGESLRLTLQELEGVTPVEDRPVFWKGHWDRYVESQVDYRLGEEALKRKLAQAGQDAWQLLEWLKQPDPAQRATGSQAQLLQRVFGEQFEVREGVSHPRGEEKETVIQGPESSSLTPDGVSSPGASPASVAGTGCEVVVRGSGDVSSGRVQNPHDPEATYAVKGQGQQKKEHVGYKVQVAESVCEAELGAGEPTRNFIVGMVTHAAHESDEAGAVKMTQEQARMGMGPAPVQYVDGAYVSAERLAKAQVEGWELVGPAQPAPQKEGRYTTEDFDVDVGGRKAICPAGRSSTQCSRLEEERSGRVMYRFEFSTQCHECALRGGCLGKGQRHRTLVVGEYHPFLQARRREQRTEAFRERMKHRNGIEGTQSELVRRYGMRRARYRGLARVRLQNYFAAAACNVSRWIRREAWKMGQAVLAGTTERAGAAVGQRS